MRMKYTFLACLTLTVTLAASADRPSVVAFAERGNINKERSFKRVSPIDNTIYRAGHETVYFWDGRRWARALEIDKSYYPNGDLKAVVNYDVEERAYSRVSYIYNENGKPIEQLTEAMVDNVWVNNSLTVAKFDELAPDFQSFFGRYGWAENDWALEFGNNYPIFRNVAGAVDSAFREANLGEIFDPIARLNNTVNADGVVTSTRYIELNSNYKWEEVFDIRDIEWETTDGQVLNFDYMDYVGGNNLISKANLYYRNKLDAKISGVYPNDFESTVKFEFTDGSYMALSRVYIDEATKSYSESRVLVYEDQGESITEEDIYTYIFDEYGNPLEEMREVLDNGVVVFKGASKNVYTYNEYGQAVEKVWSEYNADTGEYDNYSRTVASDFRDVKELGTLGVDNLATTDIAYSIEGSVLDAYGVNTIRVVSLDGKQLLSAAGEGNIKVDLTSLSPGMYVVCLSSDKATKTVKIAIK